MPRYPDQNEIHASQELFAIVMAGELRRDLPHERVVSRVELHHPAANTPVVKVRIACCGSG